MDDNDNLIAKRVLESGALTVLDPGQEDEKYQTSEIIKEGEVTYRMELRLKKTSTEDEAKQYRLEVTNSVGKEIYIYHLLIEGADDGGDNGGKDSGGGDNEGGEGGGGKDYGDDGDDGSGDLGGDGGGGDEEGGGDENGGGAGGDGEGGGGGEGGGDSDRGGNNGNGTDEGGDSDGTDEGGNSDGPDVRSGGATEMSGVTIFLIVLAVLILICALAALAIVFYQKGKWGSSEITPAVQTIS